MKQILLIILTAVSLIARAQTIVTVDPSTEYQTIHGFGAFGGIKPYWEAPPFHTEAFLDYFLDDLGATIVRTNIFWDLEPVNDNSSSRDLDITKFNYKAGSNLGRQLPYYIALRDAGLKKLIATSWTPPDWMKIHDDPGRIPDQCYNCNNCPGSDPRRKVCGGRLDPKYYHEYAEYLLAYVKILRQETGIELYGISIQNEPFFANPFESNVVKPEEYGVLLNVVGRRFREEGLSTKIFGPEHMAEWSWGVQQNYVSNIFMGEENNPYLDIYAVHGYVDGVAPDFGSAEGWTALKENITDEHNTPLWMTETSGYAQTLDGAMKLATSMYLALRFGGISAWVYWSVSGEPGSEFSLMANGEPTVLYYTSKQFFKYIRPGARRLQSTCEDPAVLTLAFQNPHEGSMTLLMINTADVEKDIDLDIPLRPSKFSGYRTSETENSAQIAEVMNSLSLPPKSITSLIGYGPAAPRIDEIPDYFLNVGDDSSLEISLGGISDGGVGPLTLEVLSSNESIVANPDLEYHYPDAQGTLTLEPNTSSAGKTVITLRLVNGNSTTASTFGFNTTEVAFTIEVLDQVTGSKKKVGGEMKVYPNPVESDVLMFDFSGMSGPRTLEVMDIHGDVVIKLGPDRLKNNEVIRIETGHWRSGMYVIRARAGREMVVEKIIVN